MSDKHSKLPPDRLWQPTTAKWFLVVFGASLTYAVVRYHFAGDHDAADDAEGDRGLALEAQSASGLLGLGPRRCPLGGPWPEGLVGADGLAVGAASDQPRGRRGGAGSPSRQAQVNAREARGGGASPGPPQQLTSGLLGGFLLTHRGDKLSLNPCACFTETVGGTRGARSFFHPDSL